MIRSAGALLTAFVLGIAFGRAVAPGHDLAGVAAARRPRPALARTGCRVHPSPLRVALRLDGTPVTGQEAAVEVAVRNDGPAGVFRSWIVATDAIFATSDPLEWTDTLGTGQMATHQARVRVAATGSFRLMARVRPTDAPSTLPSEGAHLAIRPSPGVDPVRTASATPPTTATTAPILTLSDGRRGVLRFVGE